MFGVCLDFFMHCLHDNKQTERNQSPVLLVHVPTDSVEMAQTVLSSTLSVLFNNGVCTLVCASLSASNREAASSLRVMLPAQESVFV